MSEKRDDILKYASKNMKPMQVRWKTFKCVDIFASSSVGENTLMTLEALHIKEIKPSLNTKDEWKCRVLQIRSKIQNVFNVHYLPHVYTLIAINVICSFHI